MSKIPEFLFLTLKDETEGWVEDGKWMSQVRPIPLGFASPYEPGTKAFDKRRVTQMKWAYSEWTVGHEEREDGVWKLTYKVWSYDQKPAAQVDMPAKRFAHHLQPRIVKNDPIEGFKIAKSVSRSSTSNKVWRIEDPRGFELEISTDCIEDILMNGEVRKGEIIGTLVWHTGKILRYA